MTWKESEFASPPKLRLERKYLPGSQFCCSCMLFPGQVNWTSRTLLDKNPTIQVLSKLVEDVGGEVQGKYHVDSLGLEVVGRQLGVSLVTGSGPDVGDGEGDRVGGLTQWCVVLQ